MYIDYHLLTSNIHPDATVLDLGGWDKVFPRANFVADLCPYETRRNFHPDIPEHFTKDTWIIADFCAPSFWSQFPDKHFDFITIGHTLEDIRDPLFVCQQMIRCGKAGYIEAPSKFRECAKESSTATFSGYEHHRWIIEPLPSLNGLAFKAKLSWAHHRDYLGDQRRYMLQSYFHHFDGYFWVGSFSYIEHFAKGTALETQDLEWFYANVVKENTLRKNIWHLNPLSTSPNDGQCLWVDQYQLPSEALSHHLPSSL